MRERRDKTTGTTVVSVRMPDKLVAAIDRVADAERRPRSNQIQVMLEDWMRDHEPGGKPDKKS
jgi:metal-responsive CopG/Arc/MetJ family transcriptional regulator